MFKSSFPIQKVGEQPKWLTTVWPTAAEREEAEERAAGGLPPLEAKEGGKLRAYQMVGPSLSVCPVLLFALVQSVPDGRAINWMDWMDCCLPCSLNLVSIGTRLADSLFAQPHEHYKKSLSALSHSHYSLSARLNACPPPPNRSASTGWCPAGCSI